MSGNPFEDDNDSFGGSSQEPQGQPGASAAAVLAHHLAARSRNGSSEDIHSAKDRAARMFAASQHQAELKQQQTLAPPPARHGAEASAFDSRDRAARSSISQTSTSGGATGVAFPMTDLVDAANDRKLGLSFASLAVRDSASRSSSRPGSAGSSGCANGGEGLGVTVQNGRTAQAQTSQARPAPASHDAIASSVPTPDPWQQGSFASIAADPLGLQDSKRPQQQQQQQSQRQTQPSSTQAHHQPAPTPERPPLGRLPTADLLDFDPLTAGTHTAAAAARPAQSQPTDTSHSRHTQGRGQKAAPPQESSSEEEDEDEDEEEESDEEEEDEEEDEQAKARAAEARRLAQLKRQQLIEQRAKERAEAVAYDNARKAAMTRKPAASGSSNMPPSASFRGSRALDASDAMSREVVSNERESEARRVSAHAAQTSFPKHITDEWGKNPAENWAYSKTKTRSKLMMPKTCVYWRFVVNGVRHEVELFHSLISGKRTIRCDGALVAQEKHFIDTGSRHDFDIGPASHPTSITVLICSSGSDFAYELFIGRQRFYQALQRWLIELQKQPEKAKALEPLSPTAI